MLKHRHSIKPPDERTDDDAPIWRYLDFPRFVSMLSTRTLWFAKAAGFRDDPWEGFGNAVRRPSPTIERGPKSFMQESEGATPMVSHDDMLARLSDYAATQVENARDYVYVNSWCLGLNESMAMWQIYGATGTGVAVESTVARYKAAAKFEVAPAQYSFGRVIYHDDILSAPGIQVDLRSSIPFGRRRWQQLLSLGFQKRSCFEYEREWRAVMYQDLRPEVAGIDTPFDLEELIAAVHVGPRADPFIAEAVASIMEKFGVNKPLHLSRLLKTPPSVKPEAKLPTSGQ